MTINIKSWRLQLSNKVGSKGTMHRAVRENDWRKLMRLLKAVDTYVNIESTEPRWDAVINALNALEKKK